MSDFLRDSDVVLMTGVHGFVFLLVLVFVFGLNRDRLPGGFRIWPASALEWRIYYFHTVEAVILAGIYFSMAVGFPVVPVQVGILFLYGLLVLSSLVIWFWDRSLCYRELTACVVLFFVSVMGFPAIR